MNRSRMLLSVAAVGLALAAAAQVFVARADTTSAPPRAQIIKTRIDAASKVYALVAAQHSAGTAKVEEVYLWSRRWFEAAQGSKPSGQAAKEHLARMRALEKAVKANVQSGMASKADEFAVSYYISEAELWLPVATSP